jgi:hypothetical protein
MVEKIMKLQLVHPEQALGYGILYLFRPHTWMIESHSQDPN